MDAHPMTSRVARRYVRRVASGSGLFSDKFGPAFETAMSAVYGYLNRKAKEATADILHEVT